MAGKIPQAFIDDLLARVDIVDLIDTLVPLKKTGSNNYVARCPFHSEKTPSFTVSRNKQFYYCFGCGASGSAIGFLMSFNHLGFVEAVEDLAVYAGVEVPRETKGEPASKAFKEDLSALYDLQKKVANFYARQLRVHSEGINAVNYLKSRDLSGEIARDFMLGYAPNDWHGLEKNFDPTLLEAAGLLVVNESGQKYDRFRGRIMFPIRDRRDRVIGFGGRVLDDSTPKYLNSPETAVFQKGREVYGLYEVLKKNAKPKYLLMVEGYMDVIALAQSGIDCVVATLGTATSQSHFGLLFRVTSELILCFDGDNAGLQAAWRATEAALPSLRDGRQVRIMLLPKGTDPDSLIRSEGLEGFNERISRAQSLSDYFFEHVSQGLNLATLEGRAGLVKEAEPHLLKLPEGVFRDMMFARLMELAKVDRLDVSENEAKLSPVEGSGGQRQSAGPGKSSLGRKAVALLLQNPELADSLELNKLEWRNLDSPVFILMKQIIEKIHRSPHISLGGLIESFRGRQEEKYIEKLAAMRDLAPEGGVESEFIGSVRKLIEQVLEEKYSGLLNKEKLDREEKKTVQELFGKLASSKKKGAEN